MKLSEMGGDVVKVPSPQPQETPKPASPPQSMRLSDMSKSQNTAPSKGELRAPPGLELAPDDEEAAFEKRKELEQRGKGKGDPEWETLTKQLAKSQAKGREEAVGYAPFGASVGAANVIPRIASRIVQSAQAARGAGFVLPPKMVPGQVGLGTKALEALGGKYKLAQEASEMNQPVVNSLAKRAIGLPNEAVLSEDTLKAVRKEAGVAYEGVALAVPKIVADDAFKQAVAELSVARTEGAKYFPGLVNNPEIENMVKSLSAEEYTPRAGLDLVQQLRFDSKTNLKAFMDPKKQALGLAQRKAAEAVDALMERNITQANKGPLVEAYKAARQRIARSYDIESVLNDSTGDVSAGGLARLSSKKPLTEELKTIADASSAFQKAFQDVAKFGGVETWSIGDAAALGIGLHHARTLALEAGMRPAARARILSGPVQNRLARPPAPKFEPTTPNVPLLGAVPLSSFASKVAGENQ